MWAPSQPSLGSGQHPPLDPKWPPVPDTWTSDQPSLSILRVPLGSVFPSGHRPGSHMPTFALRNAALGNEQPHSWGHDTDAFPLL